MNESLFLIHILLVTVLTLGSFRLGKLALSAWICMQGVLANLFAIKQIEMFGLHVTATDVFAVGSVLGLNLLQEHFGAETAGKTMKNCFYLMIFFAIFSQIHLFYEPSIYDTSQEAFKQLLTPVPRLLFASLLTFFIVQKVDIISFGWVKKRMKRTPFALRNFLTLLSSQLLDTILFTFLGLYGIIEPILDILIASFLIKLCAIFALSPLVHLSKKWIKHKEASL